MRKLLSCIIVLMIVGMMLMLDVITATAEDQVELRMTWWGSQRRHDRTIEVIEMFHEMHEGVTKYHEDIFIILFFLVRFLFSIYLLKHFVHLLVTFVLLRDTYFFTASVQWYE